MYSQPWSACPRAFQGRLVAFKACDAMPLPLVWPLAWPFDVATDAIGREKFFKSDEGLLKIDRRAGDRETARATTPTAMTVPRRLYKGLTESSASWVLLSRSAGFCGSEDIEW